jgi:GDP-4-dehydro-6-deoxy-D-mannose reductase
MRRCLVTGAAGFVGPHLVAALESAGHAVWTADRGEAPGARHRRIDLLDAAATQALLADIAPEWIFHLAGLSSVAYSFAHPQEVLQTNLGAACNLLEALRAAAGKSRLLLVGSAEEYGVVAAERQPIAENEPLRPASPYAVSKAAQGLLGLQYAASHDLDVVVARSFNHSGPGQSERFVLPGFARQIARAERAAQEPVLRVGNLDVWRDILDVRDVVRAYIGLLEHGERAGVYNVCRGDAYRIGDLLDGLRRRATVPLRVEVDPERWRPSDLPLLRGDSHRLRERTGWSPAIDVETMLDEILADWRRRTSAEAGA